MRRIQIRIPVTHGDSLLWNCDRPTDLGVLLRERIASLAIDWPEVGFDRIEVMQDEVRVTLTFST